jgi:RNA polymerase sigma-70 factor (ECF subfamily)
MAVSLGEQAWAGRAWMNWPLSWGRFDIQTKTEARAYPSAGDGELMAWSRHGDRRAFDEIVLRHGPFALRVARRLVPDQAMAEDIVQEAMVRAWSQARQFDAGRGQLTTWLYRIVVNLCIDARRRMTPDQIADDFDMPDPADTADTVMEHRERRVALVNAVRHLPVQQRAAMTLVYDEGLSGAEAGRVMGLSAKAIERLLARARAHIRDILMPARLG